ncbi:MAG: glycosyltransferase family 2 protein [Candidatus Dormibacteria bacterium]
MAERLSRELVRVLICTYQSVLEVGAAIESCLREGLEEAQITVVDNASRDGTAALVRDRFPQVRLLAMARNLGFSRAVNRGVQGAGGELILLLNPDAALLPGALPAMLRALGDDPQRGAISPRVEREDGRLDRACRRSFPSPAVALFRLSGLSRLGRGSARLGAYNLTHIPSDRAIPVDSGTGACLLVRRSVWDRVGGLDEGYFMYGEDLELCWQIHQLGLTVWYEPKALVLHHKGRSSQQLALPMLVHFHRSMWRFYRLHYGHGRGLVLAPLVGLGIGVRLSALLILNGLRRHPRVSR